LPLIFRCGVHPFSPGLYFLERSNSLSTISA
jgi:hypothetical protein